MSILKIDDFSDPSPRLGYSHASTSCPVVARSPESAGGAMGELEHLHRLWNVQMVLYRHRVLVQATQMQLQLLERYRGAR